MEHYRNHLFNLNNLLKHQRYSIYQKYFSKFYLVTGLSSGVSYICDGFDCIMTLYRKSLIVFAKYSCSQTHAGNVDWVGGISSSGKTSISSPVPPRHPVTLETKCSICCRLFKRTINHLVTVITIMLGRYISTCDMI